jgi:hypothetical protein
MSAKTEGDLQMRNAVYIGGALVIAAVILGGSVAALGAETSKRSSASDTAPSADSSASISVKTENGQTTVTYNGKDVFTGATKGMVTAKASSENGTEYAAAFDDEKVIWENVPGAAKHVKNVSGEIKPPAGFGKKPSTDI